MQGLAGGDTNLGCLGRWCNVLELGSRRSLGTAKQCGDISALAGGCCVLTPSLQRLMGVVPIIGDGLNT